MSTRDSTQNAFHIGSKAGLVSTTLEDSGFDACVRNSFANVPNEHFRDGLRVGGYVGLAQMKIKRKFSIRVDAGCDDDVELRLFRNTQDARDASTQTQYGKVDNSVHSAGKFCWISVSRTKMCSCISVVPSFEESRGPRAV